MMDAMTLLRSYRLELIWSAALVIGAIVVSNALPGAEARVLSNCYYDPFFNWCFWNHAPLDCLCGV